MAHHQPTRDFFRVIAAGLLPPVGVFMKEGVGANLLINVVLCFLMWIPAKLHALWLIASTDEHGREADDAVTTFIALVLTPFFPPLGILLTQGFGMQLLINLVFTAFFWLPGMVHAAWVITRR